MVIDIQFVKKELQYSTIINYNGRPFQKIKSNHAPAAVRNSSFKILTTVPAPAPTPQRQQQYAAAPIPRHLQHLYARPATPGSGGSYAP